MTDNEIYQALKQELEALAASRTITGEAAREIINLARNYRPTDLLAAWLITTPGRLTETIDRLGSLDLVKIEG